MNVVKEFRVQDWDFQVVVEGRKLELGGGWVMISEISPFLLTRHMKGSWSLKGLLSQIMKSILLLKE